MSSNDWVVWLVVYLVVAWLVVYTAVRAAVSHASDRPRAVLVAKTSETPDGIRVTVQNKGAGPALNVKIAWVEPSSDAVLASAVLLAVDDQLDFIVGAAGESLVVRKLAVTWTDAAANSHADHLPVLGPSSVERI
jgi:hypothetical protein